MNILIAPNAFKHSLDARSAAQAIAEGLAQSELECTCQLFPVADGGDGTCKLIVEHMKGANVVVNVHDPLGREVQATFSLIDDGRTAVIEMASAAGIRLLRPDELNPMQANSFGTGQMMIEALNRGVKKIIIGMGGSATVDGGVGILHALGVRFFNDKGNELKALPGELSSLSIVDIADLDERILDREINILCDVDNKLIGEHGAAAVFGPQKGATEADVLLLEAFLTKFSAITQKRTGVDMAGIKHSGTAGGAAAGLHAFINAKLGNGALAFLELTDFKDVLEKADLVITGEGSIDKQTLHGKAPLAVAKMAKERGLPVIGLAGNTPDHDNEALNFYFDKLININPLSVDINVALADTYKNLINAARILGDAMATGRSS